jgi:hypothetical protein
MRKRRGEAIAIKKSHQHEETEPTHMKVSSFRNNHGAEPGVTDNFVQCHSRGGAALCATARNV